MLGARAARVSSWSNFATCSLAAGAPWGWSSVRRLRVRAGFRGGGIRLQLPRGRLWGCRRIGQFPACHASALFRGARKPRNKRGPSRLGAPGRNRAAGRKQGKNILLGNCWGRARAPVSKPGPGNWMKFFQGKMRPTRIGPRRNISRQGSRYKRRPLDSHRRNGAVRLGPRRHGTFLVHRPHDVHHSAGAL